MNYVKKAANYVSNTFEIYNTINIEIDMYSHCKQYGDSNCSNEPGTYPLPAFMRKSVNNESILYTTPLAKQLFDYTDPNDDGRMYFNTDFCKNNSCVQDTIVINAAQQILMMLGFYTEINTFSSFLMSNKLEIENPFSYEFIMPAIIASSIDNEIFYDYAEANIFERSIVTTSNPNNYIYKKLEKFRNQPLNLSVPRSRVLSANQKKNVINKLKNIEKNKEAMANGRELYELFLTVDSVGFRTKDGSVISLQTYWDDFSSQGLSHIAHPYCTETYCQQEFYDYDQNYIMSEVFVTTNSYTDYIYRFKDVSRHELIGNDVVKIMVSLGLKERPVNSTVKKNNYSQKNN